MAHGTPDWWGVTPITTTVYSAIDMTELAARLGSINTFDRRGNIIWMDDFEDNINKWYPILGGTGANVVLSAEAARNGALSCKLTTANIAHAITSITHYGPPSNPSKIGAEISFTLHQYSWTFILNIWLYDGTYFKDISVTYNHTTGKLYYYDQNRNPQEFTTIPILAAEPACFHTMKLVADLITQKYTRFILNNTVYDLSAYSYHKSLNNSPPLLEQIINASANVNNNISTYVDDAIITQNEP